MDNPLLRLLNPQPMQYQQGSGAMPVMPQPQMQPQAMQGGKGMNFMRDLIAGALLSYGGAGVQPILTAQENRRKREEEMLAQGKEQAQLNQTKAWLKSQGREDLIPLVDAGQASAALQVATRKGSDAGEETFGLNPIYGTDPATGKTVLGTIGNRGTFKPIDTGGFEVSSGIDKVDLGTHFGLLDKRTGQVVGTMPKDLRGAEREKVIGGVEGEQITGAPSVIANGEDALYYIDGIRNHPGRGIGTGFTSMGNAVPGTPGYDFQQRVEQLSGGAFLTAIETLRGMGALSNAEGQTAKDAIARLKTAQSEGAFLQALADYERVVKRGMDKAKARLQQSGGAPAGNAVTIDGFTIEPVE